MPINWKTLLLQIPRPIIENNRTETTLFLNASGRSGSTWVSEVINYRNDYRLIFEPFHPYRSIKLFKGLTQREYLVEKGDNPPLEKGIDLVLSGRIRHAWVDHLNRKIRVEKRLIKSIRANLMIPYIQKYFPEVKIIFLIRHPLATVRSRIRMGWNHLLNDYTQQSTFCNDFRHLLPNLEKNCETDAEKHLHSWCLEHYVPLKQLHPTNVHVVYYEELLSSPMETCSKLFDFIGSKTDEALETRVSRRSVMSVDSKEQSESAVGESMPSLEKVNEILQLYNLDFLYDSFGKPKTAAESVLQKLKE